MTPRTAFLALLATLLLSPLPARLAFAGDSSASPVVATVGKATITARDLAQNAGSQLLNARYSYYLVERQVLDKLIDQQLLDNQARAEGITVDELLKRNVDDKVKNPSEEALRVYYLGVETKKPYAEIRGDILNHIRKLEAAKARAAYMKKLRAEQKVVIALLPPRAEVAVNGAPTRGPSAAPVTLIEFADYQCPYCRAMEPQLKRLESEFKGRLRVAFEDFPLPMHPYAEKAAEAAHCAGAQHAFWKFHSRLYAAEPTELAVPQLKQMARGLGLNQAEFDKCLDSGSQRAIVQREQAQGTRLGLTGTPGFFINGRFVSGAVPYQTLQEVVQQELSDGIAARQKAGGGAQAISRK